MNPGSLPTIQKQKGKACSGKPKLPLPKKVSMSKSKIKTMLIVFFNSKGIFLQEYIPPSQIFNQHYYIKILERLREQIRKKDHRCGAIHGGCIMTMRLHILLSE
jgi:hypothetical protein